MAHTAYFAVAVLEEVNGC